MTTSNAHYETESVCVLALLSTQVGRIAAVKGNLKRVCRRLRGGCSENVSMRTTMKLTGKHPFVDHNKFSHHTRADEQLQGAMKACVFIDIRDRPDKFSNSCRSRDRPQSSSSPIVGILLISIIIIVIIVIARCNRHSNRPTINASLSWLFPRISSVPISTLAPTSSSASIKVSSRERAVVMCQVPNLERQ